MRKKRNVALVCCVVVLGFGFPASGVASDEYSGVAKYPVADPADRVASPALPDPEAPLEGKSAGGAFGQNVQDYWIAAIEFKAVDQASQYEFFAGYGFALAAGTNSWVMAQLYLPAGANTARIACVVYDNDATPGANVRWNFDKCDWIWPDGSATFTTLHTSGTGNYDDTNYHDLVVDMDQTLVYRTGSARHLYYIAVNLDAANLDVRLWGCRIYWNRTMMPAPGTASFPDVDPSYPAFQEIEAVAASGIMTGFPGGNFAPDAVVTRAQMATSLARALGLHWLY